MVALSITATQVLKGSSAVVKSGTAGEAIARGDAIYKKASDGEMYLAQCDGTSAEAEAVGIALNDAADGQPVDWQGVGSITLGAGASMTVGEIYCVGTTAGDIIPEGDLASTNYVTVLGVATTASVLKLGITASGAQVP